jgi:hypothetical protein
MNLDKYTHSYSSANSFMDNKSAWILRYILKHTTPTYPAFGRGLSAEFGAYVILKRMSQFKETKNIEDLIKWYFGKRVTLPKTDKYFEEVNNAIAIAKQFVKALQEKQLTRIKHYQRKIVVEGKKYGLKYDIIMYTDFGFDNVIVDTKAKTKLMQCSRGEIRQQALYSKLSGEKTVILTATPKKFRFDEILPNDVEQGFEECLSLFKTIENFLEVCKDKHDAINITPLNTDGWMFDDYTRKKAKEIWRKNQR